MSEAWRVLVAGVVAIDDIETPFGRAQGVIGGPGTYAALAASLYAPVRLSSIVGTDFPASGLELFREKGVDLDGLHVVEGESFFWSGRYHYDMNNRDTLATRLNVWENYHPQLPASYADSELVFLMNGHPLTQREYLRQVKAPRLSLLDSMNLWIETARDDLVDTMGLVDIVTMNESEVRQFSGEASLLKGARQIMDLGPKAVLLKKGEYGAALITADGYFVAPAYPLDEVVDPTGAGDTFAAAFLGYLAACRDTGFELMKRATVHGSAVASFAVEDFSVGRLRDLTAEEVEGRYQEFRQFTRFEAA
jgi:sugar/nucleoside kinase (ribokinase family)